MLKYLLYFLLAAGLITGLVFAYDYTLDEERGDGAELPLPKTDVLADGDVIKVVPQDFPINELSDSWFGKEVQMESQMPDAAGRKSLSVSAAPLPAWLDQIISRESIVAFNKMVLGEHPDELQFSQTKEVHYTGENGWSAFLVTFETRPSQKVIAVMGAYQSESDAYWMSNLYPSESELQLTAVGAMAGGAHVWGQIDGGDFCATLQKESTALATAE